jgi:hypothetical protein
MIATQVAMGVSTFLGENKYGIMFIGGLGFFGFSLYTANKIVRPPNNNLTYLITGAGYQSPDALWRVEEDQVKSNTAGLGTTIEHDLNHFFGSIPTMSQKPDGSYGYFLDGKWYTREEVWSQIRYGQTPTWSAQGIDVEGLRRQLGTSYVTPTGELTASREGAARAQNAAPQTVFAQTKHPLNMGVTATAADRLFIEQHEDGFRELFGDKEITHNDVRNYFILKSGAKTGAVSAVSGSAAAGMGTGGLVRSEDWIGLNPRDREKKEQEWAKKAAQYAGSKLGQGVVTLDAKGNRVPVNQPMAGSKAVNKPSR